MKSLEKHMGAFNTEPEGLSAARERSTVDEQSLTSGKQKRARRSASSEKAGPGKSKAKRGTPPHAVPVQQQKPESADDTGPLTHPVSASDGQVDPHLVCLLEPRSDHAETYYRLRHQLELRRPADSALVVGVTSAGPGDGKSLTAINVAGALARGAGTRSLLLDLNLRRAGEGVADYLGLEDAREWGVVNWINEEAPELDSFTHFLEPFNLHVITSGSQPELPYELLKSPRLDALLEKAREDYDFVIIDAPQILRLPDTELISRLVDGFLIVVKSGRTRQARLEEALSLMQEDQVLGLVFNGAPKSA